MSDDTLMRYEKSLWIDIIQVFIELDHSEIILSGEIILSDEIVVSLLMGII
jgi:hypothetical protein